VPTGEQRGQERGRRTSGKHPGTREPPAQSAAMAATPHAGSWRAGPPLRAAGGGHLHGEGDPVGQTRPRRLAQHLRGPAAGPAPPPLPPAPLTRQQVLTPLLRLRTVQAPGQERRQQPVMGVHESPPPRPATAPASAGPGAPGPAPSRAGSPAPPPPPG